VISDGLLSEREIDDLCTAKDDAYARLRPFREARTLAVKQYAGSRYGRQNAGRRDAVVNMLELYVQVMATSLVSATPRLNIVSRQPEFRANALELERVENRALEDIDFGSLARRFVVDSFFGIGIMKLSADLTSKYHFLARTVDLDDWVHDMSVTRLEEADFFGDRYSARIDDIRASGLFDEAAVDKLVAYTDDANRKAMNGEERAGDVADTSSGMGTKLFKARVDLWDIYLPREKTLLTIADQGNGRRTVLRQAKWTGPDRGPYHLLWFSDVPGTAFPLPPVAPLLDLNEMTSELFRKLRRQAARMKSVGLVPGSTEDAKRVMEANDGDWVKVDNPKDFGEAVFGGPNNVLMAFAIQSKALFSTMAGNLELLGGLGPSSGTATQDKLLSERSSARMAELQRRTTGCVQQIMRDIAWYIWTDPILSVPVQVEERVNLPGLKSLSATVEFGPDRRVADFLAFECSIEPMSMRLRSPQERTQELITVFQQVLMPLMPMLAEQGVQVSLDEFLWQVVRSLNMPELEAAVKFSATQAPISGSPGQVSDGAAGRAPKPAATTRTYERVNRSEKTAQGQDQATIQMLLSGGASPEKMMAQAGGM
jgi:hypothetical protein